MPKNIVVCCDGTANEFERDRTNVVKLFHALKKDPATQACYYHPGVGTMAAPGFVTRTGTFLAELAGLAFGYGLNTDICDAYIFICRTFEPGDKVYLFGFSRGAYTVRALASLLHMYGLVPRDNERQVPYAVRLMWAIHHLRKRAAGPDAPQDPRVAEYFGLAEQFKETFSRACAPHFVGVWDTVSSVGWFSSPVALPYTANNPDIAIGRHAVAIDERRAFFRTNLWRPAAKPPIGPKDMKQVWFPGVHCDIGGGYPEAESGLAKIALKWMIDESKEAGLLLDEEVVALILGQRGRGYVPPNPDAPMHDSLTSCWKPVEFVPKPHWDREQNRTTWRANHSQPRTWPEKPVVHDTAWERDDGKYAKKLPQDAVRLSGEKRLSAPLANPHGFQLGIPG